MQSTLTPLNTQKETSYSGEKPAQPSLENSLVDSEEIGLTPNQIETEQPIAPNNDVAEDGHSTADDVAKADNLAETDIVAVTQKMPRKIQWRRFLAGMLVTATGLLLMLVVTAGMIVDINDELLSLPVVAVSMIVGLMMLGGGFGVMATASPSFDDGEFDRLMAESRPQDRTQR